jgi:hypothetical protein
VGTGIGWWGMLLFQVEEVCENETFLALFIIEVFQAYNNQE